MAQPPAHVIALARERNMYVAQGRPERGIPIDDEMGKLGWCVDTNGDLVEVKSKPAGKIFTKPAKDRAVQSKAPETTDGD